jgi:serine phosphatase RsbU (regulator of sigma subunit)
MTTNSGPADPAWFNEQLATEVGASLCRHLTRVARSGRTPLANIRHEHAKPEKEFLLLYVKGIPSKYTTLGLLIRPFREFCRTCIITEEEINTLVSMDIDSFSGQPDTTERRDFFRTLNYLIPACLKEAGFEIVREEEAEGVTISLARKIARAIHSGYLREINRQASGTTGKKVIRVAEFDDLPDEIRESNISHAIHIPTKLLAIGYRIRPVRKGYKAKALHLDDEEVETMARVEHLRWSWEKRLNGWTYGRARDERHKRHPNLVPYEELTGDEKEKDRELVRLVPGILSDIRYEAYPVSSEHTDRLAYALKPRSSIHKLLMDANDLSAGISLLAGNSPEIMEKLRSIDDRIRLTINEVEGSYNYARYIQDAFLPGDLDIRVCFTDSFVLFEPRDIVSGDFYLFSRREGKVTFGLADCTGHGIPAALISTIGYGILDQAVNVLKIDDPSETIAYLYSGIHMFLRKDSRESGISDDMTIVLCRFDPVSMRLNYAGAGNAIFYVTDGKISENLSEKLSESQLRNDSYGFTTKTLQLNTNDMLYICSDGFADQFGGGSRRRYGWTRLREYLLEISSHPMAEQGDMLFEELERWRGEKDENQTDDITVIGIRV